MKRWSGVVAIEGRPSDDERVIVAGALELSTALPMPLYQYGVFPNGDAPIVGSIDTIAREGERIVAGGILHREYAGRPELSMTVDRAKVVREDDGSVVFTQARLAQVCVGGQAVWAECVLNLD